MPVSAARSQPHSSCTRLINSSRIFRGKSRSMSGTESVPSGRNRSRDRSNSRGSMWERPIRYPTSIATEEPLPRPGGFSSRGISRSVRPRSIMTSRAIWMMS